MGSLKRCMGVRTTKPLKEKCQQCARLVQDADEEDGMLWIDTSHMPCRFFIKVKKESNKSKKQ